jgi:hypothetical protein
MTTELYRDRFGAVTHDLERSVLELDWFESTAFMTRSAAHIAVPSSSDDLDK